MSTIDIEEKTNEIVQRLLQSDHKCDYPGYEQNGELCVYHEAARYLVHLLFLTSMSSLTLNERLNDIEHKLDAAFGHIV